MPPVNAPPPVNGEHRITQLALYTNARVNRFEEKAGFATAPDLYEANIPVVDAADAIRKQDVIDLTDTRAELVWEADES